MENLNIRPEILEEFIGQENIVKNLNIYIEASINRNEILDHCLLYGSPGLGKTTLARIIANEVGGNIKEISGSSIKNSGDVASILSRLNPGDVLFIDEIHRIDKSSEELLYSAMEDFKINIICGSDTQAHNIEIDLPPFILIGATTKISLLSKPFRDRFGISFKFENYDLNSLRKIVFRTSQIYEINLDYESATYIASISRGIPRIANKILRRIRDFNQINKDEKITITLVKKYLKSIGIDENGLTDEDKKYIDVIKNKFNGGPVGINLISQYLNDDPDNIETIIESYLLQKGIIERTSRGRKLIKDI